MNKPTMFIPSNFTTAPDIVIIFEDDCDFRKKEEHESLTVNNYKSYFDKNECFRGWSIILEDEFPVFMDKLEFYTGEQKERLI